MTYRVIPDPEVSGGKWVPGLTELRPSRQYFRTGLLLKQREYFPYGVLILLPSHKAARITGCL
jgi:hypothetical protein